mgnify:CR=1 FL=1
MTVWGMMSADGYCQLVSIQGTVNADVFNNFFNSMQFHNFDILIVLSSVNQS